MDKRRGVSIASCQGQALAGVADAGDSDDMGSGNDNRVVELAIAFGWAGRIDSGWRPLAHRARWAKGPPPWASIVGRQTKVLAGNGDWRDDQRQSQCQGQGRSPRAGAGDEASWRT